MKFTGMSTKAIRAALESAKVGSVIRYYDWQKKLRTMAKRQNGRWYGPDTAGIESYGNKSSDMAVSIHSSIEFGDDSHELILAEQYESFKIVVKGSHRQPIRRETFESAWGTAVRIRSKEYKGSTVEGVRFDDDGIHFDLVLEL